MNRFSCLIIAAFLFLYGTGYPQSNSLPDEGVSYTALSDDHCWTNQKHDDHKFLHTEEVIHELQSHPDFVAALPIHSVFHSPVSSHIRGPPASIVPA